MTAFSGLSLRDANLEIIRATALQLAKELGCPEPLLSGNRDTAYEELCAFVYPVVATMIDRDFHRLASLMYRCDISEKKIKHALAGQEGNPAEAITLLFIRRAFEKVMTRKYFTQQ